MSGPDRPRIRMRNYWIALAVIVAFTAVPYLLFEGTNWLGNLTGCQPDFKRGSDCDPLIQSVNMWSAISMALTVWVTVLGLPIWLVTLILDFVASRVDAAKAPPDSRP